MLQHFVFLHVDTYLKSSLIRCLKCRIIKTYDMRDSSCAKPFAVDDALSKHKQFQLFKIPKKWAEEEQRLYLLFRHFFSLWRWVYKKNYNFIYLIRRRQRKKNILTLKIQKSLFENYNSHSFHSARSFKVYLNIVSNNIGKCTQGLQLMKNSSQNSP